MRVRGQAWVEIVLQVLMSMVSHMPDAAECASGAGALSESVYVARCSFSASGGAGACELCMNIVSHVPDAAQARQEGRRQVAADDRLPEKVG